MAGTRYNERRLDGRSRGRIVALALGISLVVSQAIGVMSASAGGELAGVGAFSGVTTKAPKAIKVAAPKTKVVGTSVKAVDTTVQRAARTVTHRLSAAPVSSGANISTDFVAAGPFTYNHTTTNGSGNLPRYGDRTISKTTGVVESLEGGDFKCGDNVVFFTQVHVAGGSGSRDVTMNLAFTKEPTGQPGAGFDDIVSATLSTNDSAAGGGNANLDGNETVSLANEDDNAHFQGKDFVTGDVVITNLDPGDTLVAKVVAHLGCDVGASPTGNLQALVNASSSSNNQDSFNVGNQTIPFKKIEDVAQPGINVVKTADAASVQAGNPIGFTITVSNDGNVPLSNVTLTDPLPTGPGVSWSVAGTSGDTTGLSCSISTNTLTCTKASLAANGSFTVHVTSPTTGDSCKTYNNTATVTSGQLTDSSSDSVDVTGCTVDLSLTKDSDVVGSASPGDSASFSIVATNNGNATAKDVTVTDTVPAGLTIDSATFTGGSNGPGSCDVSGQDVSCDVGDLAAGASATVTIDVTVTEGACPSITNTATVSASNETGGTGNNTDSTSFDVDCSVNLKLTKSSDVQGSAVPGDAASFTIVATNTGNATAKDVVVTDTVPAGLTIDSATFTGGSNGPGSCDVSGQDVSCDVGDLAAGASATVTIDVTVTEGACPSITNTATVTASNETGSADDNSASTSFDVGCVVNLTLDKTASVANVRSGKGFTYTIAVSNDGNATATNVHVTDSMPAGVAIDSATFTGGSNGPGSCDVSGRDLDCDLGSLAGGATATVTIAVTVDDAACPSVTNNASVSADNETGSTDDNSDSVDVGVTCVLPKTVTPPPSTTTPPGGTAFTGSTVLPLGTAALIMLVIGTALLYLGRRREEDAEA